MNHTWKSAKHSERLIRLTSNENTGVSTNRTHGCGWECVKYREEMDGWESHVKARHHTYNVTYVKCI